MQKEVNSLIKNITAGLIETSGTNNPFEICEYLDIKIIYSSLKSINGFFQRTADGYEIIHINSEIPEEEQKYVCAHELGHALLHPDMAISFFIQNKLLIKNKFEIQADMFAAELLIDLDSDEPPYLSDLSTEQLSSYFSVPAELIKYKFDILDR